MDGSLEVQGAYVSVCLLLQSGIWAAISINGAALFHQ
jgi:hypothetical protein